MKKQYSQKGFLSLPVESQIQELVNNCETIRNQNNLLILSKQIPSQDNQQKIIIQNKSIQQLELIKQNDQLIESQKQSIQDLHDKITNLSSHQSMEVGALSQQFLQLKEDYGHLEVKFYGLLNLLIVTQSQDFAEIVREYKLDINKYTKSIMDLF
jgi:hypothetical protein